MTPASLELACYSAECAPPPVGRGGSERVAAHLDRAITAVLRERRGQRGPATNPMPHLQAARSELRRQGRDTSGVDSLINDPSPGATRILRELARHKPVGHFRDSI